MKAAATAFLVFLFMVLAVCIVIVFQALAKQPSPSLQSSLAQEQDLIATLPVIVRPGLTVESCAEDIVVITSPLEDCRYVSHTKRIDTQTKRVTVTVRCIHDQLETTP